MTDTSTELYDRFVAYLQSFAVGSPHAQTAVTICHALALEPTEDSRRQLRACAHQASRCGVLLCSGQRGYYLPETPAEVDATTMRLESEAWELLDRSKRMKRLCAEYFAAPSGPPPRPALFALLEAS